jgi:hypothetical protein
MGSSLVRSRVAWLAAGLLVGALVAGSGLSGWWMTPVQATATDRQDNFAVTTGWVDQDMEGVFFLDSLTGVLKGAVLNAKSGKFTAFYQQNILADLEIQPDRNPKFLLVTGGAALPTLPGGKRLGNSVIYIVEVTTGRTVAYGIPWVTGNSARTVQGISQLIKLDVGQFRQAAVRE